MTPPDVSGMAETVLDGVPDVVAVGEEAVLGGSIFEVNDAINELRVVDLTHLIFSLNLSKTFFVKYSQQSSVNYKKGSLDYTQRLVLILNRNIFLFFSFLTLKKLSRKINE